ncbi:hypothetical protein Emed_007444 [Eimeria media]
MSTVRWKICGRETEEKTAVLGPTVWDDESGFGRILFILIEALAHVQVRDVSLGIEECGFLIRAGELPLRDEHAFADCAVVTTEAPQAGCLACHDDRSAPAFPGGLGNAQSLELGDSLASHPAHCPGQGLPRRGDGLAVAWVQIGIEQRGSRQRCEDVV